MAEDSAASSGAVSSDLQAVASGTPLSPVERARLDAIFGEVLPETTRDERAAAPEPAQAAGDEWLCEQVPPHHG